MECPEVERTVQSGERMVCVNGCQLYAGYTAYLRVVGNRVVTTRCARCAKQHQESLRVGDTLRVRHHTS